MAVHKLQKDGTLKVPRSLLKRAGLKPGINVFIQAFNSSLIIERVPIPFARKQLKALKPLRGSFKHIDWETTRRDMRERWSAWRNRLSA